MMRTVRLVVASVGVSLGSALFFGCVKATPPKLGPDGTPVFEGRDFRHPSGEPFFCFAHTTPQGDKVSSCREIQAWCARDLQKVTLEGLAVLSGCEARDEATCLTFYRGDATKTACFATKEDCGKGYAVFTSPSFGARPEQLAACTTIDKSFQPPR